MTMSTDVNPEAEVNPRHGQDKTRILAREAGARLTQMGRSRPFLAYLILVTVLAALYFWLIATPLYVSNTTFSIRGREQAPSPTIASSLLGGAGADVAEPIEVSDFIRSPQMLAALDKQYHLRELYSRGRLDPLNRMSKNASDEDFLKFYRKMVIPRVDRESMLIRVEVRSYDAKSAHDIANGVLEASAHFVDNLSAKIREDTVKTAQAELTKAENDVRQARLNVTRYRTATGVLDPSASATATSGAIQALEAQVAQVQGEAASIATYSTANAPLMRQNAARLATLRAQIAAEKQRLASSGNSNSLAEKVYQYEGLAVDKEYAEKRLVAALESFDQARALASQRERFVVRVVSPNYPDEATLPRRFLSFIETVLVALAAYAIVALAIAGVSDHQGI
ncbi:MAG: hypothetical protein ACXWVH_04275 [Caulobacteraceae bacterium]